MRRADTIALGRRAHATRRHAAYSRQESSPPGEGVKRAVYYGPVEHDRQIIEA